MRAPRRTIVGLAASILRVHARWGLARLRGVAWMSCRLALVMALAGLLAASGAAAGPSVRVSVPGDGEMVARPSTLELRFDGRVEARWCQVTLIGPAPGRREVFLLNPATDDAGEALRYRLPRLSQGEYRVQWKVTPADGRATEGAFVFFVAPPR
jgi:methionine-rich copper-binding protein CopC